MNVVCNRWMTAGLGAIALMMLNACAVEGVGVDGSVGVGYVGDYYQPYGYDYGGWGHDYRVGPGRSGYPRSDRPSHSYRPAPPSRPTPSIPNRSRGGGGSR